MVQIRSEVGRLRQVILQPPGEAHERMLPEHIEQGSQDYLLFDDLVDVHKAQAEHGMLTAVFSAVAEVHEFQTLLAQSMEQPAHRAALIEQVAQLESLSDADHARLDALDPKHLAATLIVGTEGGDLDAPSLFAPAPNLIFTRDLAPVVGELVVVGNASKKARRRETMLAWSVVNSNPLFEGAKVAACSAEVHGSAGSTPLTIEGGDVLVISSSLVCIGASERTSWAMIVALSEELLDSGFTRVLVVEMPKKRSAMHLDTVFTMLNWDVGVVYPPLLVSGAPEEARVLRIRRMEGGTGIEDLGTDLLTALADEGHPMQAVLCGGGHPIHAAREQWTDGANYVALGPGVVMGYARNYRTGRALEAAGFDVLRPEDFLSLLETDFKGDADALFASGRRLGIHLQGSELSRGRGGPRCLSWPIWRDA